VLLALIGGGIGTFLQYLRAEDRAAEALQQKGKAKEQERIANQRADENSILAQEKGELASSLDKKVSEFAATPAGAAGLRAAAHESAAACARVSSQDLVQSACCALVLALDSFEYRGEEAFRGWLYKAVANKVLEHEREATRSGTGGGRGSSHAAIKSPAKASRPTTCSRCSTRPASTASRSRSAGDGRVWRGNGYYWDE